MKENTNTLNNKETQMSEHIDPKSHPFFQKMYDKYFVQALDRGADPGDAAEIAQADLNKAMTPRDPSELRFEWRSMEDYAADLAAQV